MHQSFIFGDYIYGSTTYQAGTSKLTSMTAFPTIFGYPMKSLMKAALALFVAILALTAAELYRKPPQAVLDVLNAPPTRATVPRSEVAKARYTGKVYA